MRSVLEQVPRNAPTTELLRAGSRYLRARLGMPMVGAYLYGDVPECWSSYLEGVPAGFAEAYERDGRHIDPVHAAALARLEPVSSCGTVGASGWRRCSLYRSVSQPFGLGHVLEAPVVVQGKVVGSVHAARTHDAADGFGTKDLLSAAVVAGWLADRLKAVAATQSSVTTRPTMPALTARQAAVVRLVAEGMTDAQVARRLGVGEQAVKQALKRLYARTGTVNRAQLVAAYPGERLST